MVTPEESDWWYLAGYLDGEGCFTVSNPRSALAVVTCTNTHKPTIEWLRDTFGGSIAAPRVPKKANHRPTYTWNITGQEAIELISKLAPYLKEKARQALLIMKIQDTKNQPLVGRKVDPIFLEERKRLIQMLKDMKHEVY